MARELSMQQHLRWIESLKEEGQYLNKQLKTQQNTTLSATLKIQALQYLQVKTQQLLLRLKRTKSCWEQRAEEQKWLRAYTNKQSQDKQLPPTANQILKEWKNIHDNGWGHA